MNAALHAADEKSQTLSRRRIYILPTRFGLVFGALIFAMLLGSLNYGANLGFLLTFLLCGLGIVTMHHCHRNLLGLTLRGVSAQPVFAGDSARFVFTLGNETALHRFDIRVRCGRRYGTPIDVPAGMHGQLALPLAAPRRGWLALPRCSVTTRHPAKFFHAWSPVRIAARCLVYPQPAAPGRPLPEPPLHAATGSSRYGEGDDFAGLRTALPHDPPRRIAWKAYARSDQWLLKEFSGARREAIVLNLAMAGDADVERSLSQLTRWCLDAEAGQRDYGLDLPGTAIAPDRGHRHLATCLKALALFGSDETA